MRSRGASLFQAVFIFFLFLADAGAQEIKADKPSDETEGRAWAFYIENDSHNIGGPGSDQAYSNGFKFSYIFAENRAPRWAEKSTRALDFLDSNLNHAKMNFGLSVGQQIYTPNDTATSDLITDDRPYAGWLYLGLAASFKEENVGHFFELDLGVVGPSALGEQVQNNFHRLIQESPAEGWKNGLHDEPTVELLYQKRFKAWQKSQFDFVPYYGGAFGNVKVGVHVGALVRAGINLPDDFGPSRPSASDGDSFVAPNPSPESRQKSYYAFAGSRGNAVLHNIFLDGNTWQPSPHVKKYPLTFETEFGVGFQLLPYSVVWRFVTRSPEFEERSRVNSFASLNVMYFFK